MKIRELQIDRFGVWNDLALRLSPTGVNVFYGPNEAGKSTLMRYIRSMLYGFRPQDEKTAGPNPQPIRCAGSLKFDHTGREYNLRRMTYPGTRGRIQIDNVEDQPKAESLLKTFVGGTSEGIFENVFAIGLQELQELATLDGEEVARHIYGISLGPDGERILKGQYASDREGLALVNPESHEGELFDLARNLHAVEREMASVGDTTRRHSELTERRDQLDAQIQKTKQRQEALDYNLRAMAFFERVHGPWLKERNLRMEMVGLPGLADFPKDGLQRLDDLEGELDEFDTQRRKLVEEIQRLERQAEAKVSDGRLDDHISVIRQLLDEQREIKEIERRLGERRQRGYEGKKTLDQHLADLKGKYLGSLEGTWDVRHLEQADTAPRSVHAMVERSKEYRTALWRRANNYKTYKKLAGSAQKRQAALEDRIRGLGGLSLVQAREHCHRRIGELERLLELRNREENLAELHSALGQQIAQALKPKDLPLYFYATMWFFGIAGMVLFLAGLYSILVPTDRINAGGFGGHAAWIAGACFMLIGICCGGVTWSMKEHFEPTQLNLNSAQRRKTEIGHELDDVRREIDRITRQDATRGQVPTLSVGSLDAPPPETLSELDVASQIRQRLVDFDDMEREALAVDSLRERLSKMRSGLKERQRRVSAARRDWCELLKRLGLRETLKISEAFALWEKVAEAKELWSVWSADQRESERDDRIVGDFKNRVEGLARRIQFSDSKASDHHQLLVFWDQHIRSMDEARAERQRLRREVEERNRTLVDLDTRIGDRRSRRSALLNRGGAASRDELVSRLKAFQRLEELQRLHKTAVMELEAATKSEKEIAIVEEDLLAYDPKRHEAKVAETRKETRDLDVGLQENFEKLGRVKQELAELENDRRLTTLKFDHAQIVEQMQKATEKWMALQLAGQAVERIRARVERNNQPEILKHASEYLDRLTLEKYHNIWTPLGQRHIVVDDDKGESLKVEHLSNGTREQVFLAIRLAMVKDFAERGVEIPMVLDDVVVNFDQVRTEAAVQTLMEFADAGQQILLFTCHLHLAHMFESQGIEPIWLPARSGAREGKAVG
jgi:uncharacterized protein YhaN